MPGSCFCPTFGLTGAAPMASEQQTECDRRVQWSPWVRASRYHPRLRRLAICWAMNSKTPASKASHATMQTPKRNASDEERLADRSLVNQKEISTVAGIPQTSKRMPVEYIRLCQSGIALCGSFMLSNDPAQAGRGNGARLPTETRSRPCLEPDGYASALP